MKEKMIEKVAIYLNVDQKQFSVLDQFVNKAATEDRTPEELARPDYLQSTGMEQKFSNAGFDMASAGKSLFGFLGPVLLGSLAGGALGGRNRQRCFRWIRWCALGRIASRWNKYRWLADFQAESGDWGR